MGHGTVDFIFGCKKSQLQNLVPPLLCHPSCLWKAFSVAQIWNNLFNLSVPGPDLTTLTLVDLPGVHFANNDPRMNHATQSLVLDYIEKNTKSIIVIVSEVGDLTGDNAINLVMEKAADFRSRTICVLTKPDRLRDSDDMGLKVALNQSSFTLEENRFILLRGTHKIMLRCWSFLFFVSLWGGGGGVVVVVFLFYAKGEQNTLRVASGRALLAG